MDTSIPERHVTLQVRIANGHVSKTGNYFVSAVVQLINASAPLGSSTGSASSSLILPTNIQRTDVCKNTTQLIFRNQTFKFAFRLPETAVAGSDSGKATLLLRLFEITSASNGQIRSKLSNGPVADGIYELNFNASSPVAVSQTLPLVSCLGDSPRSNGSVSSDEPSIEDFGSMTVAVQMTLKTKPRIVTTRLALPRVDESDSEAGSPRSIDSGSSSAHEQNSPESSLKIPPSMFPPTRSLPGSALYQRLVRGSKSKQVTGEVDEGDENIEEGAEPGLLGSSRSVRTEDYVFFVRCYGYCNLANPTRCFLTVKTTRDVAENRPARAGTMASPIARNFVWQEPFTVDVGRRERATSPDSPTRSQQPLGLFISLIDSAKKTYLGRCIIPVDRFVAGEQYNLSLVLDEQRQSYVLLSILLQPSLSFQTSLFLKHTDLCRLEVFLHGVRRPRATDEDGDAPPSGNRTGDGKQELYHPFGSNVIAVLHVEEDFTSYLRRVQEQPPKAPFQALSLVSADAPLRVKPTVYQISPPSQLSLHPQWHCLLEFTLTTDEIHAPSGAIVIELFDMDFPKDGVGSVRFCGWAAVPLRSLSRPGVRDGDIVSESATLHNLPWGPSPKSPTQGKKSRGGLLRKSALSPPISSLIDCEYSNSCSRHDYTIAMQSRRWVSRSFVRHLLRIQSEGVSSTSGMPRSRDLSDIPPGSGLSGGQPAPLLRSQSQSNSQSIIDWAANRKKQAIVASPQSPSPLPQMSNSTPNLPAASVPKRRTSAAPAPLPSVAASYLTASPSNSPSTSLPQASSPAPMLRNKSKSSAVIVTEKPQPSGAVIGPSPPVMLGRLKQIQQQQQQQQHQSTPHQSPGVRAKQSAARPAQVSGTDSDEYQSCDDAFGVSPPKASAGSPDPTLSSPEPGSSDTEEDFSNLRRAFQQDFSSRSSGQNLSRRSTSDDASSDDSSDGEPTDYPNPNPPLVDNFPPQLRRRDSPEVPPVAGARAPVVSPAPVRPFRAGSTSATHSPRHTTANFPASSAPPTTAEPSASRSRTSSASSSGLSRPPLHVVVDPHKPPSASPSPKSPTGHAVPLSQYFRASSKASESSNSDSDGEAHHMTDFNYFSTPPGSPMQLMSVLTKLERMLTKKLQKKKKTINELRDQLNRSTEDASRLRSENSVLQGQNQVLREEMERLRRERDSFERRASDAQLQFRQFVKSMQQSARSAGMLSSSSASSSLNSWNASVLSTMVQPPTSAHRRPPSYDGYSEDDASDFETQSPQRQSVQPPIIPQRSPARQTPPPSLSSLMNGSVSALSIDIPSLAVEVGSTHRDDDLGDISSRTGESIGMDLLQEDAEYSEDDGSASETVDTSPVMRRATSRAGVQAPRPVPSRPPIKQSYSFSSAGSSNSSKSRDSMLTFPGSVGSGRSAESPRVNPPTWSDDEALGDPLADEFASNSSKDMGMSSEFGAEVDSDAAPL
eukprot:TRINITY_DN543_c0_g1_i2.p1 TRINITY_DN543_c0_g1~~TRINITY_DN543_c0_g1_i2.p1  ORF type:complete len:1455 (-),score=190.57 TRINITY_DN543_c0_g1_i2:28-4392(-)